MTVRLFYFLTAMLLASCSEESQLTNVESGIRDQILYVSNGPEPEDIDPHVTTGVPEHYIQQSLFEGLVTKNPSTLEPVPGVAKSWEVSEDLLRYTFHLRDNARWSNGDPVTADDFIYAWKRSLSPILASEYAYMLYPIKNASSYNRGQLDDFTQVGVSAPDPYTLEVVLESPTPWFLQLLDHNSAYPVHRQTLERFDASERRGTDWTRPGNFVGNGPFHLKEWSPNKVLVVEKNPLYWDAEKVRLNQVHYYVVENKQTEERMYRVGQIHMTLDGQVLADKVPTYQEELPGQIRIYPYLGVYYYLLNTTRPPFNDVRVRRALSLAIDRQMITEKVILGGKQPATTFTPPDTAGYNGGDYLEYNPEQARSLLAEAGYANGQDFPSIELLFNTHANHAKVATALQQMWKQQLNVDITLVNQEWMVYLNSRTNIAYDIARAAWLADYADPDTFLGMFTSDSGNNHTGWTDAEYDRLIAQARQTVDQSLRYNYYREAESILMDQMPVIPLYHEASINLVHPSVKGLYQNPMTYYPFKYVYLSETE